MKFRFFKKFDDKIEKEIEEEYKKNIEKDLFDLQKKYAELLAKSPVSTTEYANRIADLEIKMAKLWGMLIEQSPRTGKDKLSNEGKRFGGQSRSLLGK